MSEEESDGIDLSMDKTTRGFGDLANVIEPERAEDFEDSDPLA